MSRMSAAEAGRKGGLSRSTKKLAAAARNGFQKTNPTPEDAELAKLRDDFAAASVDLWRKIEAHYTANTHGLMLRAYVGEVGLFFEFKKGNA